MKHMKDLRLLLDFPEAEIGAGHGDDQIERRHGDDELPAVAPGMDELQIALADAKGVWNH